VTVRQVYNKEQSEQKSVLSRVVFTRSELRSFYREASSLVVDRQADAASTVQLPPWCRVSCLPWPQLQGIAYISISSDLFSKFRTSATIRLLRALFRCFICFRYWSQTKVDMLWFVIQGGQKVNLFYCCNNFVYCQPTYIFFGTYILQVYNYICIALRTALDGSPSKAKS